jgi:hypothetical protein
MRWSEPARAQQFVGALGICRSQVAGPVAQLESLGGTETHRTMRAQIFLPKVGARAERFVLSGSLSLVTGGLRSLVMNNTSESLSASSFVSHGYGATPNHALQRTAAPLSGRKLGFISFVLSALRRRRRRLSLSLGR